MGATFSPSINIIRDEQTDFEYIVTPNVSRIVNQLHADYQKGLRAFNLIGSYGTGKSSFLLALEQTLAGSKIHFKSDFLTKSHSSFIKIVGGYHSLIDVFAERFNLPDKENGPEHVLSHLGQLYHTLGSENSMMVIVLDEMGKFLEYAAKNNPERELYFLQQLAEFVNTPKSNIILITTLHQSFDTYGFQLGKSMRDEWAKVRGRFKEIAFNEPVEQLLFLAAEYISKATSCKTSKKAINSSLRLFDQSKSFRADYSKEIAEKLFPLDVLSANVLTMALQRYGQNERSLFSFLESTDLTSLSRYEMCANAPFYGLQHVFDYLIHNFFAFLHSKYNPDAASWSAINVSIEHAERAFDKDVNDYLKIVKAIGLLNIFSNAGSVLDEKFLVGYSETCLGVKNSKKLLSDLESKKIIRYRKHSRRFVLSEEAEIDIELALIKANDSVTRIADIPGVLRKYFEFTPVLAKEYSYTHGTSRYFQFEISDSPRILTPTGEIDGYIHLVFNENLVESIVSTVSEEPTANIFVVYRNSGDIKDLLFELEKTEAVLAGNRHDKVAKRELESIAVHQRWLLNHYILNNLYTGSNDVVWFWNNEILEIQSKKQFNKLLTRVCNAVYYAAPRFKNELVNKNKLSSAIHTAKRNYFKGLANFWDQDDFGIPANKFPPEKMILKSLLEENGIAPYKPNALVSGVREGDNFYKLWRASNQFLDSSKCDRRSLVEFVNLLSAKPFKLKQGFIDFWIPSFLFLKRDDFALYADSAFVPVITDETLELMAKKPKDFHVKAFDIEGVRLDIFNSYRTILNQEARSNIGNITFIETIKPFIVFYKTLPGYVRNTQRLSKSALAIRNAIAQSKDPEYTFFEAFPMALNTTINELNANPTALTTYTSILQDALREIRTCFDGLVERFEGFIKQEILFDESLLSFDEIKLKLQRRFKMLKRHLLLQKQKAFMQRVDSQLDEKRAWLSSICQSLIGKALENITDEDEPALYEAFKSMVQELENLTELSVIEIDETREEVFSIQFASFGIKMIKNTVRVPKIKAGVLEQYIAGVESELTENPEMNKIILTTLLQKVLNNG